MRHTVVLAALVAAAGVPAAASAHALFPGQQTVLTYGERAIVRLQAANGRKDVSTFVVEVFEGGTWTPSKAAVATPSRLIVRAPDPGSSESSNKVISLLVDLDGKNEERLRVCTRSTAQTSVLLPQKTQVNTRVCANVTVRKAQ
jgi:hypothetical protein